jgi:hypothetical protein
MNPAPDPDKVLIVSQYIPEWKDSGVDIKYAYDWLYRMLWREVNK